MSEQLKAALSVKLDSEEAYNAAVGGAYIGSPSIPSFSHGYDNHTSSPWWFRREAARLAFGVYTTSDVLQQFTHQFARWTVAHVSTLDPKMVAYTPDAESGCRDKQVTTTCGRFMRKYFPLLTDSAIQSLEQKHYAEVLATIEWADTATDVQYVYQNMEGDSACMRYSSNKWGLHQDLHPSHAYVGGGLRVAFTRDDDGAVKSRAVTWINPADPTDKRYVRCYGAPLLKTLLEREGYVAKDLYGATLAKVPWVHEDDDIDTPEKNAYVVPYIDGCNGDQNKPVYIVDIGDRFLITELARQYTIDDVMYAHSAKNHNPPKVRIAKMPDLDYVCAVDGQTYNRLDTPSVKYYNDGVITAVAKKNRPDGHPALVSSAGSCVEVWVTEATKTFLDGRLYVDDAATRQMRGHHQLSTTYYPDATWTGEHTLNTTAGYIRSSDAVAVMDDVGGLTYVHSTCVAALRKQGYINCSPVNEIPAIIHRNRATMRRTVNGTVFDCAEHEGSFVQTIDDKWLSNRSARRVSLLGAIVYIAKSEIVTDAHWAYAWNKSVAGVVSRNMEIFKTMPTVTVDMVDKVATYVDKHVNYVLRNYNSGSYVRQDNGLMYPVTYRAPASLKDMWEGHDAFYAQIDKQGVEGNDDIDSLVRITRAHMGPVYATLKAIRDQAELEAAGQMRIDAPTTTDAVSDERFALAA